MMRFKELQIGSTTIYLILYSAFEYADYLPLLTGEEHAKFNSFQHTKRKTEYLATRILKHKHFGSEAICYSDIGAPYFKTLDNISISHCHGVSAIAINKSFPIGLDLEHIDPKAQRLHTKFLNEEEIKLLDIHSPIQMTRAWSAKESLYKLAQTKGIIFKEQLLIDAILEEEDTLFKCSIMKASSKFSVTLKSIQLENLIISINTNKIQLH